MSTISPKGVYGSIKADFIPYKEKIVYYFLFSYPGHIESNMSEIANIKDGLISERNILKAGDSVPISQICFQKRFLNEFSIITDGSHVRYEGISIASPFIALDIQDGVDTKLHGLGVKI
ncbi:MAG: hypothetical protein FWE34_06600 [Defluviitaleaceae bacterium]|nr:hypothetical protein [Defluviitaleaceae bacterium]